ncbi:MAG: hypothetical protein AB7P13_10415 [Candidatus Nitrosocosmicus sp.]
MRTKYFLNFKSHRLSNLFPSTSVVLILAIGVIGSISIGNGNVENFVFAQTSQQNQTVDTPSITANNSNNVTDTNQVVTVFPANFTRAMGTIASIQNNETGEPAWILSGSWELLIPKPLKINQTNPSDATPFSAIFEMVKTDGTMRHTHTISNFNLTGSQANQNALVLTGTASVLMPEGLVENVPVSLSIVDQDTLKLWVYPWVPSPEPKDYHFGKTPIYGLVSTIGIFFTYP